MFDEDDQSAADDEVPDLESTFAEPDPESNLPDPESDLPSVPSVDVPTPPSPDGDAPPELLRAFWSTVLVFNVALLATSVGAMMLAFGVERRLGAGLLAVGVLSLLRGYRKYRTLDERHRNGELTDDVDDHDGSEDRDEERNG